MMITIKLKGNEQDIQKAVFVLKQVFEGMQVEVERTKEIDLIADNLPDNQVLGALLKTAEWNQSMNEIMSLQYQPIVTLQKLNELKDCIEAGANLASDLEEGKERISKEVSEALEEIERIESSAVAFILSDSHPAL